MGTPIDYQKELKEIEAQMKASAKFAEKLPVFAEKIMRDKRDGSEHWVDYGESYKDIYLSWGINRGFLQSGSSRQITNYKGDYSGYYFSVHVNSFSLYDLNEKFGLYEALEGVDIFFADEPNTTFYITDEHIESFLEALNTWYLNANKEAYIFKLRKSLKGAQADVERYTERLTEAENG